MLSVKCWALPANCAQKAGDKVPGCLSLPWPLLSPFPPRQPLAPPSSEAPQASVQTSDGSDDNNIHPL